MTAVDMTSEKAFAPGDRMYVTRGRLCGKKGTVTGKTIYGDLEVRIDGERAPLFIKASHLEHYEASERSATSKGACTVPGADPEWWSAQRQTSAERVAIWTCKRRCPVQAECAAQALRDADEGQPFPADIVAGVRVSGLSSKRARLAAMTELALVASGARVGDGGAA